MKSDSLNANDDSDKNDGNGVVVMRVLEVTAQGEATFLVGKDDGSDPQSW